MRYLLLAVALFFAQNARADEAATAALAEVNATRAARGLPPFQEDPGLTAAAQAAADYRAAHLLEGHTSNDFQFLPAGESADAAGCAAWPPSMGWGSCCMYESWQTAGAAWAMGRDGRRYMHLFVRNGPIRRLLGAAPIAVMTAPVCVDGMCTIGTCARSYSTFRAAQSPSCASCSSCSTATRGLFGRRGGRCRGCR